MPGNDPDRDPPPPDQPLHPEQQDQHSQGVVANADTRMLEQQTRREDMRLNMMRSLVTEPLLSRVQNAQEDDRFDVIISLNEMFGKGVPAALAYVEERAKEWRVPYTTSSHYIFASLNAKQI